MHRFARDGVEGLAVVADPFMERIGREIVADHGRRGGLGARCDERYDVVVDGEIEAEHHTCGDRSAEEREHDNVAQSHPVHGRQHTRQFGIKWAIVWQTGGMDG
jgi:hypothetical protein